MLVQTARNITPTQHHLTYLLLAFVAMSGLSYLNFLPGVVNALAGDIGFSESAAGQIVALNSYGALLGSSIAILLVRPLRGYWQPTLLLCLLGLLLLDIATAMSGPLGSPGTQDRLNAMLCWRFAAGAIGGLALSLAVAQLAKLDNPDRAFGTLLFVQFSVGSLVMMLLPGFEAQFGAYAVFYLMAGLSLLSLLMLLWLPAQSARATQHLPTAAAIQSCAGGSYRHACLLLLAIGAYQLAASAIWAYAGLIGLAAAISPDKVNNYIAATGLLGLLGALIPMLLGQRYGRQPLLLAGTVLSITAAVLLNFAAQHWVYLLALALLFLAWPAVQSYLLAVSAAFDRSGRLSSIASLVAAVGMASGPLMASMLLAPKDFSKMLYSCAAIFLLSYLLSYLLLLPPVTAQQKTNLTP